MPERSWVVEELWKSQIECVFINFWKMDFDFLIATGNEFLRVVSATENALEPFFVFLFGKYNVFGIERSELFFMDKWHQDV